MGDIWKLNRDIFVECNAWSEKKGYCFKTADKAENDASIQDVDKEDVKKVIKFEHMNLLNLDLYGDKLKAHGTEFTSKKRKYTGWDLLECIIAYRLETKNKDKHALMFQKDLTCLAYVSESFPWSDCIN